MSHFVVRSVERQDAAAIAEVWLDAARHHEAEDDRFRAPDRNVLIKWRADFITAERGGDELLLVVEDDGRVIGELIADVQRPSRFPQYFTHDIQEVALRIRELTVLEADRHRGGGAALMRAAEDSGRRRGATRVWMTIDVRNERSSPLCQTFHLEGDPVDFWQQL